MFDLNYAAILVAAIGAFIVGAVWNGALFGNSIMKLRGVNGNLTNDGGRPGVWRLLIEFGRCAIITFVVGYLVVQLNIDGWIEVVKLGILIWLGFPVMILVGAILWENVPPKLAAIHAGDWLVKIMLVTFIANTWR